MQFVFLHILKQVVGMNRIRYEVSRAQHFGQRQRLRFALVEQVFPRVENAEDIVNIPPVHGKTGQSARTDQCQDVLWTGVLLDGDDIHTAGHHFIDFGIVKFKNIFNQFLFTCIDRAFFFAQIHH